MTPCLLPWFNLHVWGDGAVVCCFLPDRIARYKRLIGGPYAGVDIWRSYDAEQLRDRMRCEGPSICSQDCTCWSGHGALSVGEQVERFQRRFGGTDEQWEAIRAAALGIGPTPPRPLAVNVFLGSRCNCRCPMCDVREDGPGTFVLPQAVANLRNLCADAAFVHFGGGDLFALTDVRIAEALSIAPHGARVETTTNGQGLTLARWQRFVSSGPITGLRVSLDTVQPHAYAMQRGADLSRVAGNLTDIAHAAGPRHRILVLSAAVNGWTLRGLPELVRFAATISVPEVCLTPTYGTALADHGHADVDIYGAGWSLDVAKVAAGIRTATIEAAAETGVKLTGIGALDALANRRAE